MPKHIPIRVAEHVGRATACRQVIVLAFDGELTHVITWGKSIEDCAQAAAGGNELKKKWGWPANTLDQPSRIKKILHAIEGRQKELGSILSFEAMEAVANDV